MSSFDEAIDFVLRNEKGLVNNSHDNGKITNHGISLRFLKNLPADSLRKYGVFEEVSEDTIRHLTLEQAKKIYHDEFWLSAPFEKIGNQAHCNFIFDMAINMGIAPAIKCVQRACWAVMQKRDLIDDGVMGVKTLDAIKRCGFLMMPPMRSERAGYYRLIVQNDGDQKDFINGWLNRAYESK